MLIRVESGAFRQTKWYEYASRFLFGGLITVLTGIIAKEFGPVVAGLFLAFPAIFPASATLIEKHERKKREKAGIGGVRRGRLVAGVDAAGAAMGCLGLVAFAVIAWQLLPRMSTALVLFLGTAAWFGISGTAWVIRRKHWVARRVYATRNAPRNSFKK